MALALATTFVSSDGRKLASTAQSDRPNSPFHFINFHTMKPSIFSTTLTLTLLCLFTLSANAQWQINGTNINNTNSGKVGIGLGNTGIPAFKLHVVGDRIRLGNNLLPTAKTIDMRVDGAQADITANNASLQIGSNTGNTIIQELSGRVGVGTSVPAYKMHVVGDRIRLGSSKLSTAKTIDLRTDGTAVDIMASNANLFLSSNTGNTIIQGFGRRVGIGTGNPLAELHVEGTESDGVNATVRIGNGPQTMLLDGNEMDVISNQNLHLQHNSAGNVFMVRGGGSVGIGVTTDPTAKLHVGGDLRCFNLFTNSDRRYKTGIRTFEGALDKLLAMRGTRYDFAAEQLPEGYAAGKQVGFIAQEMKEVMPELVKEDAEGMMSVNYIGVIPVLVEALKEQHEVIEEKETRIAALEAQNTELKDRLARIEAALGLAAADRQQVTEKPAAVTATVSPNPTSGQVTVSLNNTTSARSVTVKILDSTGREVASRSAAGESILQFDLSQLPAGTYVAQVMADGKMVSANKIQLVK